MKQYAIPGKYRQIRYGDERATAAGAVRVLRIRFHRDGPRYRGAISPRARLGRSVVGRAALSIDATFRRVRAHLEGARESRGRLRAAARDVLPRVPSDRRHENEFRSGGGPVDAGPW